MDTLDAQTQTAAPAPPAARITVFVYSLAAYVIGMTAMLWLIASVAGLIPFGTSSLTSHSLAAAVPVNLGLLLLFGLQHTLMARRGFKHWWTRWVNQAAERSTYVLTSGIALGLLLWLWQPLGGPVWSTSQPYMQLTLWTLSALGWLYLVAATFVTNHFDLFGLRQGWLYLRGKPYAAVPFVRTWMYRYSRHPMMAGILVGLWATPRMTLTHLILAIGLRVYIAIGVTFEERELLVRFGEHYRHYRKQVGLLMPRLRT